MNLRFQPNYLGDALEFHFSVTNSELNLIPVTTKVNDLLFRCVGDQSSIADRLLAMAYLAQIIETQQKANMSQIFRNAHQGL